MTGKEESKMGLDMYLYKFPKNKTREQIDKEADALFVKGLDEWLKGWKEVYEVAYWRKVNFLHGWFVRTLGGGKDECQDIEVRKEDLERLQTLVDKACALIGTASFVPQKDVAKEGSWKPEYVDDPDKPTVAVRWKGREFEGIDRNTAYLLSRDIWPELSGILPPQEGFFFGSYRYDYWYAWDMMDLRNTLKRLMDGWDDEFSYIYEASW